MVNVTKRSFAASASAAAPPPGGKIGRMLDMGGMPSSSNDTSSIIRAVNASKNCKLQAVAFDFDVLTKSFDESSSTSQQQQATKTSTTTSNEKDDSIKKLGSVQPDLDQINQVASLLQVNVDGTSNINNKENGDKESESSLLASILSSEEKTEEEKQSSSSSASTTTTSTTTEDKSITTIPNQDIRAKYASKLMGGLAGLELAKSQLQNTLKGGDAAGHLAARKIALQETSSSASNSTKWMAITGTGKLLSYLTHRSIRIALLPNPKLLLLKNNNNNYDFDAQIQQRKENNVESMKQFSKQLKDVIIDIVVDYSQDEKDEDDTKKLIEKQVLNKLDDHIVPQQVLIVSDSDEYLKAGRDLGMMTCRIRPLNARRGNITTNYSAKSIPDIQEVINEINGISFNAVLNR